MKGDDKGLRDKGAMRARKKSKFYRKVERVSSNFKGAEITRKQF